MIRVLLFLTFFVISSAANATAESFFTSDAYLEGKVAFDAGNYESAVKIWIKSAEKGYPEAQGFIGGMYHAGLGVEKNYHTKKFLSVSYQKSAALTQNKKIKCKQATRR